MITIKKPEEIKALAEGGKILAEILEKVAGEVMAGVSTGQLNKIARDLIFSFGARPAFEGYRSSGSDRPYPAALCTSLNDVVVHGVPSFKTILKSGDILKLDLGIIYKNLFTDSALTVVVDSNQRRDTEKINLLRVTKEALALGIAQVKAGNHIGDIGMAIDGHVKKEGMAAIRALVGHGVGYAVHEEPNVPNYGRAGGGPELEKSMVLAIEPMVTLGGEEIDLAEDGFGYRTADGSLSAHFEHTVVVTESGCLVLTKL